jgi:hypothetical protein
MQTAATTRMDLDQMFETAQLMTAEARGENERALFSQGALNNRHRELDDREGRLDDRDKRLTTREERAGQRKNLADEREKQADTREREQMEREVRSS